MRPKSTVLFLSAIASLSHSASADEWEKMVFIPARNGETAQIIDETGKMKAVVEGLMGVRPMDCPPSTFWSYDVSPKASMAGLIISCDDDQKAYKIQATPYSVTKGGFALVPATDPRPPGTDDPGPSKSDPTAEPEVSQ